MMAAMTDVMVWLNKLANACGAVLLAPIAWLPGWASITMVAAVTGCLMLVVFKYTSNQAAIKRVRNEIRANLLALSLFDESVLVSLELQLRLLLGAGRLLSLAIVPMLVMAIPVCLLLGQLAAWYQARPLAVAECAVVAAYLAPESKTSVVEAEIAPSPAFRLVAGPVRIAGKKMICWKIAARETGQHTLVFQTHGQKFEKKIVIGDGCLRLSSRRPAWHWADAMANPCETPFSPDSIIQAIEIAYPERDSLVAGGHSWLIYWFVASMVFAYVFRPLLKVDL